MGRDALAGHVVISCHLVEIAELRDDVVCTGLALEFDLFYSVAYFVLTVGDTEMLHHFFDLYLYRGVSIVRGNLLGCKK